MFFKYEFPKIIIFLVIFPFFSCVRNDNKLNVVNNGEPREDVFDKNIISNIDIEIDPNGSFEILLKTKHGCGRTGFILKRGNFFTEARYDSNLFIVSTLEELKILQERYFELSYLDTFSMDYFQNNYLVFILHISSGGYDLRNERIEVNNGKYSFVVENWLWAPPPPDVEYGIPFCLSYILYVLQLPKYFKKI